MNGLTLSREYWMQVGRPAYERMQPELLDHMAVGLAGEGSECFGFDDEISRDHDWGPGFCLWLTEETYQRYGAEAAAIYARLPRTFRGYTRQNESAMSGGRVGVLRIGEFYGHLTGCAGIPESSAEWNALPEHGLAAATNGAVFSDKEGRFTAIRAALLAHYPEQVFYKRLAAHCALAAQSGQYNYYRCQEHGEPVAAFAALAEYIEHIEAAVFLLNRRYKPFYKWAHRALRDCPVLGREAAAMIEALTVRPDSASGTIEQLAALLIAELRRRELTHSESDFLLHHAEELQERITEPQLAALHLMDE